MSEEEFLRGQEAPTMMNVTCATRFAAAAFAGIILSVPALAQIGAPSTAKPVPQTAPRTLTAEEIARTIMPGVVMIICESSTEKTLGSGFFVKPGVVATNYHVIDGMQRGAIIFPDGNEVPKEDSKKIWVTDVLAVDTESDLALLAVPESASAGRPVLRLAGNPQAISVGQKVFALGNPEGLSGTISEGIVSANLRKVENVEYVQITAPISHGSSGGPVVNAQGEVIGVAVGSQVSGQNLNFAVPAPRLLPLLARSGSKRREETTTVGLMPYSWRVPKSLASVGVAATAAKRSTPDDEDVPSMDGTPSLTSTVVLPPVATLSELNMYGPYYRGREYAMQGLRINYISSEGSLYYFDVSEPETGHRLYGLSHKEFYFYAHKTKNFMPAVLRRYKANSQYEVRLYFTFEADYRDNYKGLVTRVLWLDKKGDVVEFVEMDPLEPREY
jgi:S1-C subfamily serine protease